MTATCITLVTCKQSCVDVGLTLRVLHVDADGARVEWDLYPFLFQVMMMRRDRLFRHMG
jgi:hypothetical protein